MKKLSLLLALLALSTTATACGITADPNASTGTEHETAQQTATSEEEHFDPFSGLPEKDYNGYEFRMLLRPLDRWTKDMYVTEESGDIVDDEVFRRNALVEETYDIRLTCIPSSDTNYESDGIKSILANEDAYDLIIPHGRAAFLYANQKLLFDWNTDLPYVRLDQPWWDQDARDSLSINDKLYVMIGDISYCSMSAANVMLFNKNLCADLDIEAPYQQVLDGKWTFEVFQTLARSASMDMNGDGTFDKDYDRFGYVTQKWVGPVQAFATSGLRVIEKDSEDMPYLSFYSDRTVEVFQRYFDLIDSDTAYVDLSDISYSSDFIKIFEEGRSLFIDMNMADVVAMRAMDCDFGIIPWPKYDEAAEYCTNVDAGTNLCVVPITNTDTERTSIILESLAAIGYQKVIPAYYEVALQTKASRDNASAEMLDIIKGARIYDLGYYNEDITNHCYSNEFVDFVGNPALGRDITSWYEKSQKAAQRALEKITKAYTED